MNTVTKFCLLGLALGLVGCVDTVTQTKPGMKPAYRDRIEARYQKPVAQVFEAAKRSVNSYGHITSESELHGTNQVRLAEGSINGRSVYIRIEQVDAQATLATVQVRTKGGGTDLQIAKDVVRRIGVELN
jgi:hypothetical protein